MEQILQEARRVLKPDGLLAFQCDPDSAHDVRPLLNQVFGLGLFVNEIVWERDRGIRNRRTKALLHSHESILIYSNGPNYRLNIHAEELQSTRDRDRFPYVEEGTNRRFRLVPLTSPSSLRRPLNEYHFMGRVANWRFSQGHMRELLEAGRIVPGGDSGVPRYKQYLDERAHGLLGTVWADIPLGSSGRSYEIVRPRLLLERIVALCSNENNIILDPFCGTGTSLIAAELLGRQWIGIGASPVACRLAANMLRQSTGVPESEIARRRGEGFVVRAVEGSEVAWQAMGPEEFEAWVLIQMEALPAPLNAPDLGIDGRVVIETEHGPERTYPVEVKATEGAHPDAITQFVRALERLDVDRGFFVEKRRTSQLDAVARDASRTNDRRIIVVDSEDLINGRWRSGLVSR